MAAMREAGYYWILLDGQWQPAEWLPYDVWQILATSAAVREDQVTTVGQKLEPPTVLQPDYDRTVSNSN